MEAGAEAQGRPEPRLNKWEAKANVAAYEAEREVTPATKADVREVQGAIQKVKAALYAATGKVVK